MSELQKPLAEEPFAHDARPSWAHTALDSPSPVVEGVDKEKLTKDKGGAKTKGYFNSPATRCHYEKQFHLNPRVQSEFFFPGIHASFPSTDSKCPMTSPACPHLRWVHGPSPLVTKPTITAK